MATLANLVVKVTGDSSSMERMMDRTERRAHAFAGKMAKAVAGVFAADQIARFGAAAVREFAKAESVWGRLATTVEATGTSFEAVRGQIDRAAGAMQRATTVGDEEFAEALQKITLQVGDVSKALGVMDIAADLSASRQIEISEAADLLGKALAGNTTQLTRMFPALKGSTDLLGDLRKMLAGAAEGEVKTLDGATKRLTNSWDNFKESIGRGLVGGDDSVQTINNLAGALQGMSDWMDSHSGFFEDLRQEFSSFATKTAEEARLLGDALSYMWDFYTPGDGRLDALKEDTFRNEGGKGGPRRSTPAAAAARASSPVIVGSPAVAKAIADATQRALDLRVRAFNPEEREVFPLAVTETDRWSRGFPTAPLTGMAAPGGVQVRGTVSQGPGALSGVLGQVTSGFSGLLASFGPMAVVAEILTTAFEAMAPALEVLKIPIKAVGELLGQTLGKAISYLAEGIGWVIRAFGKAVNWLLPGNPANGMVKLGQEMMDQAKAVRSATEATEKFAESLSNVPTILSINRLRHGLVSGGVGGSTTGGGGRTDGGGGTAKPRNPPIVVHGDLHFHGVQDLEGLGRAVDRVVSRGGTPRLSLAPAA